MPKPSSLLLSAPVARRQYEEMKRLRLRDVFLRFPALDRARVLSLAAFFRHGIGIFDRAYEWIVVATDAALPFAVAVGAKECPDLESVPPAIYPFYHGHMVQLLALRPRSKMTILVSNSRDGEMIARAARDLGFSIVRGSPAHGGTRGALELVSASKEGKSLLFTVDGPRGPIYSVNDSIMRLAEMTGLPIVPSVCHGRVLWYFNTWDCYMGPWWHTPVVCLFADPIYVPQNCDDEVFKQLKTRLDSQMTALRIKAAEFFKQS